MKFIDLTKRSFLIGFALFLTSCATPEYRAERNTCKSIWMSKIPPDFVQEQYNKEQSRQVSSGNVTCHTIRRSTICNEQMKTEYYTTLAVRTVDRNEGQRDAEIKNCTQSICLQKFGNINCKK
jgi:hypothetical protein